MHAVCSREALWFGLAFGSLLLGSWACRSDDPADDRFGVTGPGARDDDDDDDDDDDTSSGDLPTPIDAGKLQMLQLSAGDGYTCALWNDGKLQCWGLNDSGQLGLGDTKNRGDAPGTMGAALAAVDLGDAVIAVRTGSRHACAVLRSGAVKCWGNNFYGNLGQPDDLDRGLTPDSMGRALAPVELGAHAIATELGLGSFSTCVLLAGGSVKCFGDSLNGELGYGDDLVRGGKEGGEDGAPLGDALPPVDIGFSGVSTIKMGFGAVDQHSCASNDEGELKCWGGNTLGQLGLGDTNNRGDDANEMGGQLPKVPVGEKVVAMSLGDRATCVVVDTGQMRCWGFNFYGQLGLGDNAARGLSPGNLPLVHAGTSARALDVGIYTHTCAVFDDRTVRCWGRNESGQLGLGDRESRGDAPEEIGTGMRTVDFGQETPVQVAVGRAHTCVRFASHKVKCWGDNTSGTLGYGDTTARGGAAGTMGSALPYVDLGR